MQCLLNDKQGGDRRRDEKGRKEPLLLELSREFVSTLSSTNSPERMREKEKRERRGSEYEFADKYLFSLGAIMHTETG